METIHEMGLQPEPFEAIRSGKKIIESRLYDEKRKGIKLGDIIEFSNSADKTDKVKTVVIALLNYPKFEEMFDDFPPEWFGLSTKELLLTQIEQFYSPEAQTKYGVLGIKLELLP